MGEEKGNLLLVAPLLLASHARNSDQILREPDQLLSLYLSQHSLNLQWSSPPPTLPLPLEEGGLGRGWLVKQCEKPALFQRLDP